MTNQQTAASAIRSSTSQGAASEPRIRVKGLAKRYGRLEVFRDIDFDVAEREIVAVVGPSGCGKTTLLRCIDGLLPHDAGEIWVGNQRVEEPIAGVAMVFQHFGLFPWKTVFDNVAYGLRMAGAPKAEVERKVPGFIKLVGLTGFETAFPYQMSGGMIMGASQDFDTAGVFASILVIGVIGVGLTRLGLKIEQHFARWRL